MQTPSVPTEQHASVLLEAINNPDLIRGGKAVDTLRHAVQALYNGLKEGEKQLEESKAAHAAQYADTLKVVDQYKEMYDAEVNEARLWRRKYEELEQDKSFVLTSNGKH